MEQPKNSLPEWVDPQGSRIPAYLRKAKHLAKVEAEKKSDKYLIKPALNSAERNHNENVSPQEKEEASKNFQSILEEVKFIKIDNIRNRNESGKLMSQTGEVSHYQDECLWKIIRTPTFKRLFNKGGTANPVKSEDYVKDFLRESVSYGSGEPKFVHAASLFPSKYDSWELEDVETLFSIHVKNKNSKEKMLECETCHRVKKNVRYRHNAYQTDVGNDPTAMHTVCDVCDYENAMNI